MTSVLKTPCAVSVMFKKIFNISEILCNIFKFVALLFDHPVYSNRQICYLIKEDVIVQVTIHCFWPEEITST